MKKSIIFDIAFIILLGLFLVFIIESGRTEMSIKFMFIPLLATYFIGKYAAILLNRKKI